MKTTRVDYYESFENELESNYKSNLANTNNNDLKDIRELISSRFSDPKMAVETYLDSFRDRTGLKGYLNQINAELNDTENTKIATQESVESLIDIPEIKESIDLSLQRNDFQRTVDFIVKLQNAVNNDGRIPEDLKGVSMDSKLIDYISKRINKDYENVDYNSILNTRESPDIYSDQKNSLYFNFESKEEDEK